MLDVFDQKEINLKENDMHVNFRYNFVEMKWLNPHLYLSSFLADSPDKNLLNRLVWELVYLCTSLNRRVQTAASQCLGEIGPVNLGLVSKPVSPYSAALEQALLEYEQSQDLQKYCVVFHLLNECLTNVKLVILNNNLISTHWELSNSYWYGMLMLQLRLENFYCFFSLEGVLVGLVSRGVKTL